MGKVLADNVLPAFWARSFGCVAFEKEHLFRGLITVADAIVYNARQGGHFVVIHTLVYSTPTCPAVAQLDDHLIPLSLSLSSGDRLQSR